MASKDDLQSQLVQHIDEALAMEQSVSRMLDGMIATTDDPDLNRELVVHKRETEQHARRMEARLEAHGSSPSTVRELGGIAGALMKTVVDKVRSDKPGRNARDGYATEAMEIASYQLLERIAREAGDEETAEAARLNRLDEENMARTIEANWQKFAELSIAQGVSD